MGYSSERTMVTIRLAHDPDRCSTQPVGARTLNNARLDSKTWNAVCSTRPVITNRLEEARLNEPRQTVLTSTLPTSTTSKLLLHTPTVDASRPNNICLDSSSTNQLKPALRSWNANSPTCPVVNGKHIGSRG